MKRFLTKCLLLVPIPAAICFVNYTVDPAHILDSDDYLDDAVTYLLSGKHVANLVNYDQRLLQKKYICRLQRSPDVIVLGSSRTMQLNRTMFPGKSFFNHSVSGAVLQDVLAIFDVYAQREMFPKELILGLDPWSFNKSFGESRWKVLTHEYNDMLSMLGYGRLRKSELRQKAGYNKVRVREMFSLAYFQASVRMYGTRGYFPTTQEKLEAQVIHADGSLYEYDYSQRSLVEINLLARKYDYENARLFKKIDRDCAKVLVDFLKFLQAKRIKVTIFLPPYHPITYSQIIAKNRTYQKVEAFVRKIASESGIEVIGGYNPRDLLLTDHDFVDGMHLRPAGLIKVFSSGQTILNRR